MPFFDLRRNLIVELKPAVLRSVLDATTARGRPVSYNLKFTVHPRDAKGFARAVADRVTRGQISFIIPCVAAFGIGCSPTARSRTRARGFNA